MPYELKQEGSQWCVYNKDTGKKNGCSDTRAMALGMMRRLYQVENAGTKQFDSYDMYQHQIDPEIANYDPLGATGDKACANCQWFDSPDGCMLVAGDVSPTGLSDLWHPLVKDLPQADPEPVPVEVTNWGEMSLADCMCDSCTVQLGFKAVWTSAYINNLPDSAFAYVEPGGTKKDGKTQGNKRHFPYKDANGNVDLPHLRNALSRAPQSPFGPKALPTLQAAARRAGVGQKSITDKVKEWLDNLFTDEAPAVVAPVGSKSLRPINLSHDIDGRTRATIVMSNNFQDRHGQIIPEVVHQEYIEWADEHQLYPEFQIYHMGSKSRWGQGDCVTRIGNFTLVSGLVDPGKEALAQVLADDPNTGVSNGYYAVYTPDRKEFKAWYPFEASALPLTDSANVWMGEQFVLESEGFLMKAEHKALLISKGVSEAFLTELETDLETRGAQVTQQGVASKAVDEPSGAVPATEPTTGLDTLITAVGTAINKAIEPLTARLDTLEAGQKAFSKSSDDMVADAILAKVGSLPQGFKATESPNNKPEPGTIQEPLDQGYDWLGKELDKVMNLNGVAK